MTDPIGGTEQTQFVYDALPMRVLFGPGRLEQLRTEVDRIGIRRVLGPVLKAGVAGRV